MSMKIKTCIKIRPLIKREKKAKKEEKWKYAGNSIHSVNVRHPCNFTFDNIFGPECRNFDVYSTIVDPIVKMALNGFNGTIFVYGETTSGKTHTMLGTDKDPGIIFLAIRQLFEKQNVSTDRDFSIRVGYIEIFKEKLYDLLSDRNVLNIDSNECNAALSNKKIVVDNGETMTEILNQGNSQRKSASAADRGQFSSRSHAIIQIAIESLDKTQVSHLNFVHLAGSELVSDIAKEGHHINKSLLWLNLVINGLSDGDKDINYRSSRLTRILQESLGGNSNTSFICTVTPTAGNETISTLNFANQAKNVKNRAVCNIANNNDVIYSEIKLECYEIKPQKYGNADHQSSSYGDFGTMPHSMEPSNLPSSSKHNIHPYEKLHPTGNVFSNGEPTRGLQMKRGLEVDKEPPGKRCKTISMSSASSHDCRSFSSISEGSENMALELQLSEIANIKSENIRLINELHVVKAARDDCNRWYNEEIKSAKFAQQKAEFLRAKAEMTINQLVKEVNDLKAQLSGKADSDAKYIDLLSQLETLKKTNADLVLRLRCLHDENLMLKNKNKQLFNKTLARPNFSPPIDPTAERETGIKNKIKQLESTVSNEIRMLKEELEKKNFETTQSTSSDLNLTTLIKRSMTIPNTLIGCVIGTGGHIMKNIHTSTGAKVEVSPRDGSNDRTVTITGTPKSVAFAMDLVKKNIENEKNMRRYKKITTV